jgi:hypothetical protein
MPYADSSEALIQRLDAIAKSQSALAANVKAMKQAVLNIAQDVSNLKSGLAKTNCHPVMPPASTEKELTTLLDSDTIVSFAE